MNRKQYRKHAIRNHQSGLKLADRIAGLMLVGTIIAGMYGMIDFANRRDAEALKISSFPSRPEEVETTETRTLDYLEIEPPAQG